MTREIEVSAGQDLFGAEPAAYAEVRPDYPGEFYERLVACGCNDHLDVASGDGRIARKLRRRTSMNLTVLEPDDRFLPQLNNIERTRVICASFEDAALDIGSFDLITVGTAFHWLDPVSRTNRVGELLKPGGFVALLWNVFGDNEKSDPFHEATKAILQAREINPSGKSGETPFALRKLEREREFTRNGKFNFADYLERKWELNLDAREVGKLYSTFSEIQRLDDQQRKQTLGKLMQIADNEFGGKVVRNMTSVMYLFRKAGGG